MGSNYPWLSTVSIFAVSFSLGSIAVGIKDIMVNTKVWNGIILVPWVSVFLELGVGSCLGLAFDGVTSWDRVLLSSNNPWLSTVSGSAVSSGKLGIAMGVKNVVVNTEVWHGVILVPRVGIFLELGVSSSLSLAFDGVAGWDRSLLCSNNPWLSAMSSLAVFTSKGMVAMSVKDIMIYSKVWYEVIFVPRVSVFLEFCMSSSFGLAFNRITSGNGCFLCSNNPRLSTVSIFAICSSICGVAVSIKNVVINTKVWYWVILIPRIGIFLELSMSGCLYFTFN